MKVWFSQISSLEKRRPCVSGPSNTAPAQFPLAVSCRKARAGATPRVVSRSDLLVAPGQVQGHLRHVVDLGVADVADLEARSLDAALER